ncbi:MAG: hypothetical protein KJ970_05610 [Candidatus Eisenbacteria bacterium]|uniref:T9SS type A sorting domain-containing protein n=1 Tax=Eiseniibacteriota bacterium TaxID=2212470 RepID=A0A948W5U1_UNCEI|nr:hypothetical protein [Candidatus Eisenbacteria bacterium]MBU1949752.1 hypothetical protein [Candidatus Eisenbacteria bacterium]MBU2690385.1 hypothetical protein [Candidatus Eisenbacteria bacterium]
MSGHHPWLKLRSLGHLVAILFLLLPVAGEATLHVVSGLESPSSYNFFINGSSEESGIYSEDGLIAVMTKTGSGHVEIVPEGQNPEMGGGMPPSPGGGIAIAPHLVGISPNPVGGTSALMLEMPSPDRVTVEVFDVRGRRVGVLWDGDLPAGPSRVPWSNAAFANPLPAGAYWVRASASGGVTPGKKVIVLQ